MKAILIPFLTPTVRPITGLVFVDLQANVVKGKFTRKLVEINIPGRSGNVLQDLGSNCVKYTVSGKWIYENPPSNISGINEPVGLISGSRNALPPSSLIGKVLSDIGWNWLRVMDMQLLYEQGQPLMFGCSFAPLTVVMINDLELEEAGGNPNVYNYKLELVEYSPEIRLIGHGLGVMLKIGSSLLGSIGIGIGQKEFGNLGY
jgi:hypothetical protein